MEAKNNSGLSKINLLNIWADENLGSEELKDKIFIAKILFFLCSSSAQSTVYNDIISVLLYDYEDYEDNISKFLDLFRGEFIDNEGTKFYHLFYRIDDTEEELIAMLNIKDENELTTIN